MEKQKVIRIVCGVCGIDPSDLLSNLRTRDISDARKIIAFILLDRKVCHSTKDAGDAVGLKRNSISKALKDFQCLIKFDAPFRFRYKESLRLLSKGDYIGD